MVKSLRYSILVCILNKWFVNTSLVELVTFVMTHEVPKDCGILSRQKMSQCGRSSSWAYSISFTHASVLAQHIIVLYCRMNFRLFSRLCIDSIHTLIELLSCTDIYPMPFGHPSNKLNKLVHKKCTYWYVLLLKLVNMSNLFQQCISIHIIHNKFLLESFLHILSTHILLRHVFTIQLCISFLWLHAALIFWSQHNTSNYLDFQERIGS
jgi:hypothetical protein